MGRSLRERAPVCYNEAAIFRGLENQSPPPPRRRLDRKAKSVAEQPELEDSDVDSISAEESDAAEEELAKPEKKQRPQRAAALKAAADVQNGALLRFARAHVSNVKADENNGNRTRNSPQAPNRKRPRKLKRSGAGSEEEASEVEEESSSQESDSEEDFQPPDLDAFRHKKQRGAAGLQRPSRYLRSAAPAAAMTRAQGKQSRQQGKGSQSESEGDSDKDSGSDQNSDHGENSDSDADLADKPAGRRAKTHGRAKKGRRGAHGDVSQPTTALRRSQRATLAKPGTMQDWRSEDDEATETSCSSSGEEEGGEAGTEDGAKPDDGVKGNKARAKGTAAADGSKQGVGGEACGGDGAGPEGGGGEGPVMVSDSQSEGEGKGAGDGNGSGQRQRGGAPTKGARKGKVMETGKRPAARRGDKRGAHTAKGGKPRARASASISSSAGHGSNSSSSSSSDSEGGRGGGGGKGKKKGVTGRCGEPSSDDDEGNRPEKILGGRAQGDGCELFQVKWENESYRQCSWHSAEELRGVCRQLLANFLKARAIAVAGGTPVVCANGSGDFYPPEYTQVERVLDKVKGGRGEEPSYLVKWRGLGYGASTLMPASELASEEDMAGIKAYEERTRTPTPAMLKAAQGRALPRKAVVTLPTFLNGKELRDYQRVGVEWMLRTLLQAKKNVILGDEMGLGKTAQSVALMASIMSLCSTRGPFLVLAPVSTLEHWRREITAWTSMDVVLFAGDARDREGIKEHELRSLSKGRGAPKWYPFNVLLASLEIARKESSALQAITWQLVIVDEAHRLKDSSSQTYATVRDLRKAHLVMLTGTPIQNGTRDLFGLLSLLDPDTYNDESAFLQEYGELQAEQVGKLRKLLEGILLRRMKDDVEPMPSKEEVIVWVELTRAQRLYYRALYEQQIGALLQGGKAKNLPNLRNLGMELRKLCNHPFLCNGLEEDILAKNIAADKTASEDARYLSALVSCSGKMVLLAKLLAKLKREGHRVLLFSQFKMMLDRLEDYLDAAGHAYVRLDGDITGSERQAAIDSYNRSGSEAFVFLLSTKAGGVGINLTSADTCIIFDSDWNPQNDLQAMARCHRIGQTKEVTIYRLVTRGTYEEQLFASAARKYGLDEAILGKMDEEGGGKGSKQSAEKINNLLKKGAYSLVNEEADGGKEAAFCDESIDEILTNRTAKRQIGNNASNHFSVATFVVEEGPEGEDAPDAAFWEERLPTAAAKAKAQQAAGGANVLSPSARRKAALVRKNYREGAMNSLADRLDDEYSGSTASNSDSSDEGDGNAAPRRSRKERVGARTQGAQGAGGSKGWSKVQLARLEDRLFALGPARMDRVQEAAELLSKPADEVASVARYLVSLCGVMVEIETRVRQQRKAEREDRRVVVPFSTPQEVDCARSERGCDEIERRNIENIYPADAAQEARLGATGDTTNKGNKAAEGGAKGEAKGETKGGVVEPDVPACAASLLRDQDYCAKFQRKSVMFQRQLDDMEALEKLFGARGEPAALDKIIFKRLPRPASWWNHEHDVQLLQGLHKHGLGPKGFKRIWEDDAFSFRAKIDECQHCLEEASQELKKIEGRIEQRRAAAAAATTEEAETGSCAGVRAIVTTEDEADECLLQRLQDTVLSCGWPESRHFTARAKSLLKDLCDHWAACALSASLPPAPKCAHPPVPPAWARGSGVSRPHGHRSHARSAGSSSSSDSSDDGSSDGSSSDEENEGGEGPGHAARKVTAVQGDRPSAPPLSAKVSAPPVAKHGLPLNRMATQVRPATAVNAPRKPLEPCNRTSTPAATCEPGQRKRPASSVDDDALVGVPRGAMPCAPAPDAKRLGLESGAAASDGVPTGPKVAAAVGKTALPSWALAKTAKPATCLVVSDSDDDDFATHPAPATTKQKTSDHRLLPPEVCGAPAAKKVKGASQPASTPPRRAADKPVARGDGVGVQDRLLAAPDHAANRDASNTPMSSHPKAAVASLPSPDPVLWKPEGNQNSVQAFNAGNKPRLTLHSTKPAMKQRSMMAFLKPTGA